MTDDDAIDQNALAKAAKDGDEAAFEELLRLHEHFIKHLSILYWGSGTERQDLRQEASVGLLAATQDYNPERGPFPRFARLCMRRRVYTFMKTMSSGRHRALNFAHSLDAPISTERAKSLIDMLESGVRTDVDALSDVPAILSKLWEVCSPIERAVLPLYFAGYSFADIGTVIGKHRKPVDNAVWRVKLKGRLIATELGL